MHLCPSCGATTVTERTLPEYHDDLMGTGYPVTLVNSVIERECAACGEKQTVVPDLDGLIAAIAVARVLHPLKLRGKELKFLRKALDYTSKRFAEELDVREETVSRWENDKEPIRPTIEKIIRLTVAFGLASKAPAVDFSGADVVGLKLQPFCSSKHMPVMRFERVRIKLPSNKKEPHWDRTDQAA